MRRIIPFLLAALCAFSLAACSPGGGTDAPADNVPEEDRPAAYTEKELCVYRDGKKIYGKLFMPEHDGNVPLVIIGHGFGANINSIIDYGPAFAQNGIAAYCFEFIGGGHGIKSDGDMTEMSVLTEAADMSAVLDTLSAQEGIDPGNIFVMGESQGGFVASYTAATRPGDVRGLIAFFPAYVLQDDSRKRVEGLDEIPEYSMALGTRIGRIYTVDSLSFDIYDILPDFKNNALLIHGTDDGLVPISYSERAVEVMPSAKLVSIKGAGHGFGGADRKYATELAVSFVKDNTAVPEE